MKYWQFVAWLLLAIWSPWRFEWEASAQIPLSKYVGRVNGLEHFISIIIAFPLLNNMNRLINRINWLINALSLLIHVILGALMAELMD